jgi:hypothetical protein
MENTVKNHIEVEGVFLSEEAIQTLKGYQHNNNSILKDDVILTSKTVCFLSRHIEETNVQEQAKAIELIKGLSHLAEWLEKLQKV